MIKMREGFSTSDIKRRARAALKHNFGKASFAWAAPEIIITVITVLVMLISPGGLNCAKILTYVKESSAEEFVNASNLFISANSLISVLFSFLSLGGTAVYMKIAAGEKCGCKTLFSFFGSWFPAAALSLATAAAGYVIGTAMNFFAKLLPFMAGTFGLGCAVLVLFVSLKLRFAPYILIDNGGKGWAEALVSSWKMTNAAVIGNLLWLALSFIGWIFAVIMTLGAAAFYMIPYYNVSEAVYYNDIK